MKYLKCFESYTITNTDNKDNSFNYYFNTDKLDYKISISKYSDSDFWSIGFKAKTPEEHFYNHDLIANDNPYKVMDTILKVAKKFYFEKIEEIKELTKTFNININEKDYVKGFVFSFSGNKEKNLQRLNLYKRYYDKFGMDVDFFVKDNMYYLQIK